MALAASCGSPPNQTAADSAPPRGPDAAGADAPADAPARPLLPCLDEQTMLLGGSLDDEPSDVEELFLVDDILFALRRQVDFPPEVTQLWRLRVDGTEAVQLDSFSGRPSALGADRANVYYSSNTDGIRMLPLTASPGDRPTTFGTPTAYLHLSSVVHWTTITTGAPRVLSRRPSMALRWSNA